MVLVFPAANGSSLAVHTITMCRWTMSIQKMRKTFVMQDPFIPGVVPGAVRAHLCCHGKVISLNPVVPQA